MVDEQLTRASFSPLTLTVNPPVKDISINEVLESDFVITGYQQYPALKALHAPYGCIRPHQFYCNNQWQ